MKRKIEILLLFVTCSIAIIDAQVITCNPAFPTASDEVVITFYADQGNMGLKDYTGDVYAHTGVITDKSTSGSDWKYVIAPWSTNLPQAKMNRTSPNVYTLTISPSIKDFYGVDAADTVKKLAFVFRSWDGSREGKTATNGDIFYDVAKTVVFNVMLIQPGTYNSLVSVGDQMPVSATASVCDSLLLIDNNAVLKKVTSLTASYTITVAGSGQHKIVARAWKNNKHVEDSAFYYIKHNVTVEDPPAGLKPGVNVTGDNSAAFLLYAPGKDNVFVIGDFNNWLFTDVGFMKKSSDGKWFWAEINSLDPDKEYGFQYLIDGTIAIPDPYTTKVLDASNDKYIKAATYPNLKPYPEGLTDGLVAVFQTRPEAYSWKNTTFTPPAKNDLVVYELLVRDFVAAHDFKTIRDSLAYFTRLGVNAIEFMPVSEFEGNSSWGYNPSMYFAVDKYYGPADSFKQLIDSCHSKGIAVIMDMVLNHAYGSNPLVRMYYNSSTYKVTPDNPWFNVDAPNSTYSWGYDFNHESPATKQFVDSVCHYWINEFKVDGIRFDFTKGFTNTTGTGYNYDASRIAILERMGDKIWSYKPNEYLILEHFTDNSEETVLANHGFMLWGNAKGQYQEASMGYASDLTAASWLDLGWAKPGIMDYMESHDEERIMYKNLNFGNSSGSYSVKNYEVAIRRAKLCAALFFTIPGPKMIWQFEELGYDISNGAYGRVGEMPIHWEYYNIASRRNLYNNFKALIELKKKYDTFSSNTYSLYQSGNIKRLNIQQTDMDAVVMGNFDVTAGYVNAAFSRTGKWYEFFTGDSVDINESNKHLRIDLIAGEYRLYTSKRIARPSFLTAIDDPVMPEQQEGVTFDIYPNPFTEDLTVRIGEESDGEGYIVEVYSSDGKEILREMIPDGISEYRWDGRTRYGNKCAPGTYLIRVSSGLKRTVKKVIRF